MRYFCLSVLLSTNIFCYCQYAKDTASNNCASRYLDSAYIIERLADINVMEFCKTLYFNPKLAGDNRPTSIILDTLENSTDFKRLPFYFYCITKSLPYTDGAYAEGVAYFGYHLFKKRTQFFIDMFICTNKMNDIDIKLWGKAIAGEIFIAGDKEKREILEKLKKEIADKNFELNSIREGIVRKIIESIEKELKILAILNQE